jgi:hypothetical protein
VTDVQHSKCAATGRGIARACECVHFGWLVVWGDVPGCRAAGRLPVLPGRRWLHGPQASSWCCTGAGKAVPESAALPDSLLRYTEHRHPALLSTAQQGHAGGRLVICAVVATACCTVVCC